MDNSWSGKQFVIERFEDWQSMMGQLTDHYGSTHTRRDTYVHTLSPHVNTVKGYPNRKIGTRLSAGKPVIEETRQCVDRTLVSVDSASPSGEYTEYKMEMGPEGKPVKVVENGKPVVIEKYYKVKDKRVHYIVTLSDTDGKDSFLYYGPWQSWGPLGSVRTVRLNVSIERVEGRPKK